MKHGSRGLFYSGIANIGDNLLDQLPRFTMIAIGYVQCLAHFESCSPFRFLDVYGIDDSTVVDQDITRRLDLDESLDLVGGWVTKRCDILQIL